MAQKSSQVVAVNTKTNAMENLDTAQWQVRNIIGMVNVIRNAMKINKDRDVDMERAMCCVDSMMNDVDCILERLGKEINKLDPPVEYTEDDLKRMFCQPQKAGAVS